MIKETMKPEGRVKVTIFDSNEGTSEIRFYNTILKRGREVIALSLANEIDNDFNFFVSRMLFGDGGTNENVPKHVNSERTGLFGNTRANKPVIATVDLTTTTVTFTSVLAYEEANGFALNEMALELNTGELYSMATFPDFNKTSSMQVTFQWEIAIV